jgi:magnesium transporter
LCGLILSVINFARVFFTNGQNPGLSLTVTASLFVTVLIAKSVGCILPLIAKAFKLDPALMAAPLITTIVDGASLVVYFSIAKLVLQI